MNPAEIFKSLHPSRLAHYRSLSGGQDADALALYEWNIEVAAALQDPLGIAEVAVRHAIDTQLCGWSQQHVGAPEWIGHVASIPYLSGPNVFSASRHNLYKAADQSRRARPANHPRHGGAITHDDLVANVMFGTWANLLPEKFNAGWVDPNGHPVQNPVTFKPVGTCGATACMGDFPTSNTTRAGTAQATRFVICGNYETACLIWTHCSMSTFDISTTGFSYRC